MVVDFIILRGDQEAGRKHHRHSSGGHLSSSLRSLGSFVKIVSIQQLNGDVGCFSTLSEFLPHLEKTVDKFYSLVTVSFSNLILLLR